MSDHVVHHQLGDSGTHSHHHHKHEHELSVSHHQSSTFHALHHEATASLSGPHHDSSAHLDKTSLTKPASVKAAESVHLSAKSPFAAKADTNVHLTNAKLEHAPAHNTNEKSARSLDLGAIPKLAITNEARPGKSTPDLASMVPQHLNFDKQATVQRTASAADSGTNLFAPAKLAEKAAAPSAEAKIAPAAAFDAKKSLSELTYSGAIVDRTSQVTDMSAAPKAAPGEVPTINVTMQGPSDKNKPDFLIHKDGSIEMFNNPIKTGQKDITVQYERNGADTSITDAQKQAGGNFYSYLQQQLKGQFPQADAGAFKTTDSQGVLRDSTLPPEVKQKIEQQQHRADAPASSGLPDHAGPTMQDTKRISDGGRHSSVPRSEVQEMTPEVKRIPNEADRVASMKDTVASYVTRGEQHPYDYVTKHSDGRGYGVGRYGMTYNQFHNWLSGMTDDQIAELIKQGKLSPEQAENLKKMRESMGNADKSGNDNDLDPFLKDMKNGTGSDDDMRKGVQRLLPDKVQELAASDQISKITGELSKDALARGESPSVNPGQVALSFVLGRTVSKSEIDGNPEYKKFTDSATQAYRLQEQSHVQNGATVNVENMSQVSSALNNMVGQQFWREAAGATEYGNKGCAIAVTRMLQHMGVQIGAHLDVTGTASEMRQKGWQEVSLASAMKSGQLFVAVNKETGSHVGIGMGNTVWENSSAKRQVVTRDIHNSTLIHSGRAFIVPIKSGAAPTAA